VAALPDFNFNIGAPNGSTVTNPQILLTVYPRQNSCTTYQVMWIQPNCDRQFPFSIEQFTGRSILACADDNWRFKVNSSNQGCILADGCDAVDIRPDGRRDDQYLSSITGCFSQSAIPTQAYQSSYQNGV